MSIEGQGHSLTLVKGHSDFKVKCLTFGLYTQVSDSGPLGPLVKICAGSCSAVSCASDSRARGPGYDILLGHILLFLLPLIQEGQFAVTGESM